MSSPKPDVISRPMKFPYTFSAKLAQFPFKFHINNNWIYKYYVVGLVASFPIFVYLDRLVNSTGNIRAHEELKKKQREAEHH